MKIQSCIIKHLRESIDTEVSQILKDVPCEKETRTSVDTEVEIEKLLNDSYYGTYLRPRNILYKD